MTSSITFPTSEEPRWAERELLALQELGFAKTDSADPEETKTARRMMLNLGVIRGAGLGSLSTLECGVIRRALVAGGLAERLQVIDKVLPLATKELRRKKGKTQNSRDRKTKADIKAQKCLVTYSLSLPHRRSKNSGYPQSTGTSANLPPRTSIC